jgi:hypothetical protein
MAGDDFYLKLRGTIGSILQIDATAATPGPLLKNTSGNLDVRNDADAAFVNVRGADPVIDDDLVTKRYGDANYGGAAGAVQSIRFVTALVTVSSVTSIPANARVTESRFEVTTVYSGGTTIDVGDGVTANLIMDNTDIRETKLGTYRVVQDTDWTTGNTVTTTVGGAPVAGAGVTFVFYTQPQA